MRGWHSRFFQRELWAGRTQLALFILCVFLASISLTVVSGWRRSVDIAMAEETRKGNGGDVVVSSNEPFSEKLVEASERYPHILTSEMFTVALAPRTDLTLFSKLKAVENGYPYYGEVPLRSGRDIHQALQDGVVVEEKALERLNLEVGDVVKIGARTFSISDVALGEPDRPMGMWGVSPRIFISYKNLDTTKLVGPGSYLERRLHFKLEDPEQAEVVAEDLRAVAIPDQERVETWQSPPARMERYVDNFFTFLDLMAVLAVSLGGLGMQSTLSAWFRSREQTIATIRSVGADLRFVLLHYSAMVGLTTVIGFLGGLTVSGGILKSSGEYLTGMLPVKVAPTLSWLAVVEAGLLSVFVTAAFAAWPLYLASRVRPATVMRREPIEIGGRVRAAFVGILLGSLCLLLFLMIGDIKRTLITIFILFAVGLITGSASYSLVYFLKRRSPRNLALRTALGSWRSPEAKSETVVFVVTTCLAVLFTAVLSGEAVRQSWVDSMPADSPNVFFLDIQPDQAEEFKKAVGEEVKIYANLRVRVQEVNGKPLDRSRPRKDRRGDGRGRLDADTATELPENDTLVGGSALYQGDDPAQVSVRDDIAEALKAGVGDTIAFSVQGVPIAAKVSSIRQSSREGFLPRFELLFPPALVEGAPLTMFASARLPEDRIGPVQTKLAKQFPGIVSMDLSYTIKLISERLVQMAGLVQYFLWSGLTAGLLILVSSSLSARERRARESAYYKVLGARQGFLNAVLWLENLILGVSCSFLGLLLALSVTWGLCTWKFEIPFPQVGEWIALMLVLPTAGLALLGWIVGYRAIAAKPAGLLREF